MDLRVLKVPLVGLVALIVGIFLSEQLPQPIFDVCLGSQFLQPDQWYYCEGGHEFLSGLIFAFVFLTLAPMNRIFLSIALGLIVLFGCIDPFRNGFPLVETLAYWVTSSVALGTLVGLLLNAPITFYRMRRSGDA